jgi:AcrR family transcriptional regulator
MKAQGQRSEENRRRILAAALKLFKAHGVRKIAVGDIARQAEVSPATVYNHFGTRDALVHATLRHLLETMVEVYRKIIDEPLPFAEKVQRMILYDMQLFAEDQGELLQQLLTSDDPEVGRIVDEVYTSRNRQWLVDFFEEGKKRGYVYPDLSIDGVTRFSEIIRKGIAAEARESRDPMFMKNLLDEIAPLYLYGMMKKPEPPGETTDKGDT